MRIDWNADDFGATPKVTRNIAEVWQYGKVNSVSVIANGTALTEAARAVLSDPKRPLRIMVHLNLSEGQPLADAAKVPMLVNKRGEFFLGFAGLWALWLRLPGAKRGEFLQQIRHEWSLQIETVKSAFAPHQVAGVDGHIHVHMLPFLFPVAASLAEQQQLTEIRITREIFHFSMQESLRLGFPVNIAKHLLLNWLSRSARITARWFGLQSPDAVAGVLYSGKMTRAVAVAAMRRAEGRQYQWLELIFHPGRAAVSEKERWENQTGIWNFYSAPERDLERAELSNKFDDR
jgi:predicted glycoside hydrolase/deacetylase ChbG (UPF0249 family)